MKVKDRVKAITATLSGFMVALAAIVITPIPSYAASGLNSVLTQIANIATIIVAIVGVIVVIKLAFDRVTQGNGGFGKIIAAVLIIVCLIGIIQTLANISAVQGLFGGVAQKAVTTTGNVANEALS